jgi:hypothetical protein
MSHAGIKGMQAAGDDLLGVAEKLTDEQLHAIADMFTFDLTTHLHYDVLAVVNEGDGTQTPAATVTSTTEDFLAWSNQRLPWSELVQIDGDRPVAERFLNALNLI